MPFVDKEESEFVVSKQSLWWLLSCATPLSQRSLLPILYSYSQASIVG
jgi:hypothetical protein